MTRVRFLCSLLLVALLPVLQALPIGAPLDRISRTGFAVGALLLVSSAPRVRVEPLRWWMSTALFTPLLALSVALDGGVGIAAVALVVAALAARAAERSRPAVWAASWWIVFAAPAAVALAFGWASDDAATGAAALRFSPFELAAAAQTGRGALPWPAAAIGAAIALLAPVLAPRAAGEAHQV